MGLSGLSQESLTGILKSFLLRFSPNSSFYESLESLEGKTLRAYPFRFQSDKTTVWHRVLNLLVFSTPAFFLILMLQMQMLAGRGRAEAGGHRWSSSSTRSPSYHKPINWVVFADISHSRINIT